MTTLKKVVFPAPFGPIRPTIDRSRDDEIDLVDRDQASEGLPDAARLEERAGRLRAAD